MDLTDSHKLLRDYADHGNESAFEELVNRYIDLVYSTALRRVGGNADTAEDVTQAVFTDLARKARSLRNVDMLGGWLHRHTGFVASDFVRSEQRRQIREQEAAQMTALTDSPDALWQQLSPVLDETIDSLEPADRQAILLRFFERHDFRSIGATLGISDDAAQKRVSRALEKLKDLLARRGVTLSVVLLGTFMAGKVVKAAPAGLAAKVAGLALAGATASAGLAATLANVAKSLAFKISLAAIVIGIGVKLILSSHSAPTVETARQGNAAVRPADSPTAGIAAPEAQVPAATPVTGNSPPNTASNNLVLTIISADSGQPIPNVELNYDLWLQGKVQPTQHLRASSSGICEVPVPDGITQLTLVSEVDGFASTQLEWNPDHGETIPAQYKLELARAVLIGGEVVDPEGNPVAGARAHFEPQPPSPQSRPQSDNFPFSFDATTDAQGRWQINRIGKEAFETVFGFALHPDFVASPFSNLGSDTNAEKQLFAGTYTFHLGHAVVVSGTVEGPDGQPVPDADVLVGHAPGEIHTRRTKTGSDGTFSVAGCEPGDNLITAQAKGLAGRSIAVDLSDTNCGPFQVLLNPGKVLKLRVLDEDGNPVPDATVALLPRPDLPDADNSQHSAPRIRFRQQTDAQGRMEWDSAPDFELTFIIGSSNYMVKRGVKVQPDGIEHVVTLEPALNVSGTVTDATTGQPIPHFRVIAGWPTHMPARHFEDASRPHWSTFERDWMAFSGGQFRFTYQSPMVIGEPNPDYMFKFQADGYKPFVTGVILSTAGSVHLDVALTPSAATEVTVLTPDNQVAVGIQIGLISQGAGLVLIPGGFSRQTIESSTATSLRSTDDRGEFALPPDPAITEVVAACPQGYAEATSADLATSKVMNLAPWGRLEGTFVTNGQPLSGVTLSIGFGQGQGLNISCHSDFQATTDDQGHFVFTQVPPGNRELLLVTSSYNMGRKVTSFPPLQDVAIRPGQTATVTIDTSEIPNNAPPTANR